MNLKISKNIKFNSAVLEGVKVMCRVFWGPDLESCRHMMEGKFFQSFEIILIESETNPSGLLDKINSIINRFDSHQSLYNHLDECYVRLFVNNREGITAPLYQSCYEFENAPMMGESAVKMNKRFKSKGLSLAEDMNEPPDHLAIELEYLYFLLENGWTNKDNELAQEAVAFAGELMLPWVIQLRNQLNNETICSFYPLSASLLVAILSFIAGFAGVQPVKS